MGDTSEYRNDEPHAGDNFGTAVLVVKKDTPGALADTDGDYTFLIVDPTNRLYIVGEITASALPSGASTSAKQLADGHNVAVSNMIPAVETGLSTLANQQPPVTTAAVYNVTLPSADTEYSQALSANTREFRFRCRTLFDVRFAFVAGKVATPSAPYLTLPGGSDYWSDNDNLASTTLYLATDEAGVVVEIEEWT